MEGTVKFFNRKKGFGFIHGDDGNDYFVHFTAVPNGVYLHDNDKVSFEGVQGDRGLKADKVQLLERANPGSDNSEGSQFQRKPSADKDEDDDSSNGNDNSEEEQEN